MLRKKGIEIIDFDQLSRELVTPGSTVWYALKKFFGDSIFHEDWTLDREKLAQIVFSDPAERARLNAIMRPHLRNLFLKRMLWGFFVRFARVIVVDAPLLFENKLDRVCGHVMVVAAPEEIVLTRLKSRSNMEQEHAKQRINAQWPVQKKMTLAHHVIHNTGELHELQANVDAWWKAHRYSFSFSPRPTLLSFIFPVILVTLFYLVWVAIPNSLYFIGQLTAELISYLTQ
eukprot:TRINITY_DN2269_c0_g1_i10.p1 TRINITY_DN2269_c0_g1~~TRINITY_DN2269_c0_g1_i10.p1  ORF type:complete len:230 (-),score=35.59 TRINITY_DN2269_c0_g1_i10:30-719(-)